MHAVAEGGRAGAIAAALAAAREAAGGGGSCARAAAADGEDAGRGFLSPSPPHPPIRPQKFSE